MSKCDSDFIVKLGTIPLVQKKIRNQNILFFSEEFVEGEDLHILCKNNQLLDTPQLIRLGQNITMAISEIWKQNQIHRDVKPQNIIRTPAGVFILLDMGLAYDLNSESFSDTGDCPGTPGYWSPEQLDLSAKSLKRELDFRSDLFSLGIVMYELASGINPFINDANSRREIARNILVNEPVDIGKISGINSGMAEIIMRLLSKEPHLRYRTCNILIEKLERIN